MALSAQLSSWFCCGAAPEDIWALTRQDVEDGGQDVYRFREEGGAKWGKSLVELIWEVRRQARFKKSILHHAADTNLPQSDLSARTERISPLCKTHGCETDITAGPQKNLHK